MERTERLLDLVALLLDAKEPVGWSTIRAAFPDDYGGNLDSAERKFERDKAELTELGIPLTYQPRREENDAEGYLVDKNAYYLPEVKWSQEELAVLYAAGSAALASEAFPAAQDLAHALRKIGFYAGEPLAAPKVRLELGALAHQAELPERLELLWAAIAGHKQVDLEYRSPRSGETTHRKVDPYGLALRRGLWSLVGYCHLRKGLRTFHVHRVIRLVPNTKLPKSPDFEVPKDFQLDAYVAAWPWQHRFHPAVGVTLQLRGALAPLAEQMFGLGTASSSTSDGGVDPASGVRTLTVQATDLDGLIRYVLSLGSEATVLGPPDAREKHLQILKQIAQAHQQPGAGPG